MAGIGFRQLIFNYYLCAVLLVPCNYVGPVRPNPHLTPHHLKIYAQHFGQQAKIIRQPRREVLRLIWPQFLHVNLSQLVQLPFALSILFHLVTVTCLVITPAQPPPPCSA